MNTPVPELPSVSTPVYSRGQRWLQVNVIILGVLLLVIGVWHFTQHMFNEIMMLLGAYHFTFILLFWVMFVDGMLNRALELAHRHWHWPAWHVPRGVSVVLAYAGIILLIVVGSLSLLPELNEQLMGLKQLLARASHRMDIMFVQLQNALQLEIPASVKQSLNTMGRNMVGNLFNLGSQSVTPLVYIMIGQLISLYLLFDGNNLTRFVKVLMPYTRKNRLSRGVVLSQVLMYRAVKAYTIQALLSGVFAYGMFKLLGLPYAGLLAITYGILCYIPVLGFWIGLLVPGLLLLTQFSIIKLLVLAIGFFGFHFLRSRYVTPLLFDRRYDLHPLIILLLLQISIDVAGLWGLLLLIPLTVLVVTFKRLFLPARVV
jgi:predicted PurR-regulated permease PerM